MARRDKRAVEPASSNPIDELLQASAKLSPDDRVRYFARLLQQFDNSPADPSPQEPTESLSARMARGISSAVQRAYDLLEKTEQERDAWERAAYGLLGDLHEAKRKRTARAAKFKKDRTWERRVYVRSLLPDGTDLKHISASQWQEILTQVAGHNEELVMRGKGKNRRMITPRQLKLDYLSWVIPKQ